MVRHAGRTDSNHTPIVQSLRSMGYSVLSLDSVGRGAPDILVGVSMNVRGQKIPINLVFEIKANEEIAKKVKEKLKIKALPNDSAQIKWNREWQGQKAIVGSLTDILHIIKAYERGE